MQGFFAGISEENICSINLWLATFMVKVKICIIMMIHYSFITFCLWTEAELEKKLNCLIQEQIAPESVVCIALFQMQWYSRNTSPAGGKGGFNVISFSSSSILPQNEICVSHTHTHTHTYTHIHTNTHEHTHTFDLLGYIHYSLQI